MLLWVHREGGHMVCCVPGQNRHLEAAASSSKQQHLSRACFCGCAGKVDIWSAVSLVRTGTCSKQQTAACASEQHIASSSVPQSGYHWQATQRWGGGVGWGWGWGGGPLSLHKLSRSDVRDDDGLCMCAAVLLVNGRGCDVGAPPEAWGMHHSISATTASTLLCMGSSKLL
jgi:hypothetical protein